MSYAYRARGAESEKSAPTEQAAVQQDEMLSNELIAAMIEQAGLDAGVDEEVDLLALDREAFYNFPEGGDRVQQKDALPELHEKRAGTECHDVENSAAFVQGQGDQQREQRTIPTRPPVPGRHGGADEHGRQRSREGPRAGAGNPLGRGRHELAPP